MTLGTSLEMEIDPLEGKPFVSQTSPSRLLSINSYRTGHFGTEMRSAQRRSPGHQSGPASGTKIKNPVSQVPKTNSV